ncbi:hypothetical protein [Methanococcus maripaludis]|uniref:Aconitase B n=2 Tax=Methanococcus maripaludis TaxID=39152 RepID=A0A7J9PHJ2_METMI|nr:hypothetical protein [Methanococcus maripaludis]MBA2862693.1 aconitase B [Methanococcus maripaludis]
MKTNNKMVNIDQKAVNLLLKAPLMGRDELTDTIYELRKMAYKKYGKRNIKSVIDCWASTAYFISMKSI